MTTGVGVLVGAKCAARRSAASPELEARGGSDGSSSPSVGVVAAGAGRAEGLGLSVGGRSTSAGACVAS